MLHYLVIIFNESLFFFNNSLNNLFFSSKFPHPHPSTQKSNGLTLKRLCSYYILKKVSQYVKPFSFYMILGNHLVHFTMLNIQAKTIVYWLMLQSPYHFLGVVPKPSSEVAKERATPTAYPWHIQCTSRKCRAPVDLTTAQWAPAIRHVQVIAV